MNELDEMLLRLDDDEIIAAFDEHRPGLMAYFDDALGALTEGETDWNAIAYAYSELRTYRTVAECDYMLRLGMVLGARLARGQVADYDSAAMLAAESIDEKLPMSRRVSRPAGS